MNRHEARRLAETVTTDDLRAMFLAAQEAIKDWTAASRVNKGQSIGAAFNVLKHGIDDPRCHVIARTNMIREFGEFLPGYEKQAKRKRPAVQVHHEEPEFISTD